MASLTVNELASLIEEVALNNEGHYSQARSQPGQSTRESEQDSQKHGRVNVSTSPNVQQSSKARNRNRRKSKPGPNPTAAVEGKVGSDQAEKQNESPGSNIDNMGRGNARNTSVHGVNASTQPENTQKKFKNRTEKKDQTNAPDGASVGSAENAGNQAEQSQPLQLPKGPRNERSKQYTRRPNHSRATGQGTTPGQKKQQNQNGRYTVQPRSSPNSLPSQPNWNSRRSFQDNVNSKAQSQQSSAQTQSQQAASQPRRQAHETYKKPHRSSNQNGSQTRRYPPHSHSQNQNQSQSAASLPLSYTPFTAPQEPPSAPTFYILQQEPKSYIGGLILGAFSTLQKAGSAVYSLNPTSPPIPGLNGTIACSLRRGSLLRILPKKDEAVEEENSLPPERNLDLPENATPPSHEQTFDSNPDKNGKIHDQKEDNGGGVVEKVYLSLCMTPSSGLFCIGAYSSLPRAWASCLKYKTQLTWSPYTTLKEEVRWVDDEFAPHVKGRIDGSGMHHWFVRAVELDEMIEKDVRRWR